MVILHCAGLSYRAVRRARAVTRWVIRSVENDVIRAAPPPRLSMKIGSGFRIRRRGSNVDAREIARN